MMKESGADRGESHREEGVIQAEREDVDNLLTG